MRFACMHPQRQRMPRWPKIAVHARGDAERLHQLGARAVHDLLIEQAKVYGLGLHQLKAARTLILTRPVASDLSPLPLCPVGGSR